MTKRFYLQSTLKPDLKFQILERNPKTGETKLQGIGAAFTEVLTKEKISELNYKVVAEEVEE